jgi:DNA-binding protein H-NS
VQNDAHGFETKPDNQISGIKMDISSLSLGELNRLKSRVEAEISRRTDTAKRDLIKKMQKMAAEAGVSLEDLIGPSSAKPASAKSGRQAKPAQPAKKTKKVAAQYRHPADASLEWTGRGRKPLWVAKWLEENKSLDGLRIAQA